MNLLTRRAEERDWARLMSWRNDPETVKASRKSARVGLEEHWNWLRQVVVDESAGLYIVSDSERNITVGTGRIDERDERTVEISITVDPRLRGQGYAPRLVRAILEKVTVGVIVLATVKTDNVPSLRAFADCGFLPARFKDSGLVELELKL